MTITIYHNNACSNSRGALALIREAGFEPVIIDYLKEPPTRARLAELIAQAGLSVRGAMRDKGDLYVELGLADPALINRPFVVTEKGVRLCRPPALVHEIL